MASPDLPEYEEPIFTRNSSGNTREAGESIDSGKGRIFPCEGCGADLQFNIGQQKLVCPFCGFEKQLVWDEDEKISEQNYEEMLLQLAEWKREQEESGEEEDSGQQEIHCASCGADVIFVGSLTSSSCPYCSSPLQREEVTKPPKSNSLWTESYTFCYPRKTEQNLKTWISSLRFAPNEFRQKGIKGNFEGVYLPYWTFGLHSLSRILESTG
ncbi:MAG: hypothetical protein R3C11_02635 [Planctomycetaceae bacterium]